MGWSDPSLAKRYMHVTEELVTAIAAEVGGHIWTTPDDDEDDEDGLSGVPVPA